MGCRPIPLLLQEDRSRFMESVEKKRGGGGGGGGGRVGVKVCSL